VAGGESGHGGIGGEGEGICSQWRIEFGHRLDAKKFAKIFRFPVTSNL
jgi:hypothetical protein